MERLISHLNAAGYLPVMRSMFASACRVLGLPEPGEQAVADGFSRQAQRLLYRPRPELGGVVGEVLLFEDTICIVAPHRSEMLRASVVGHGEQEAALRRFCQDVEDAIRARFDGRRLRGMDFTWRALTTRELLHEMRGYAAEREDSYLAVPPRQEGRVHFTEPEYTAEDLERSRLLVDDPTRDFVLTLARAGKIRGEDAGEMAQAGLLDQLVRAGLVAQEYLLTCRRDRHTICVMPSKDGVMREPTASLECSVCGRPFRDENLEEIYALTDGAKNLLQGSRWMHVWVTELLLGNGVRRDCIRWSFESQGDELDIMVEDFDSRIFFELKDREFGLGDAYPFVYRLTRYGGQLGVVATMDKVSPDAKTFFEEGVRRRDSPSAVRCVEGATGIETGVAALVSEISLSHVRRLVGPFSDRLGFDLWPLIEPRIASGTGEPSPTSVDQPGDALAAD
jgi:hypothetical protein